MKIRINGEAREVQTTGTLADLVAELGLPAPTLLLELNGVALRRDEWTAHTLAEGDQVEILRISAGG